MKYAVTWPGEPEVIYQNRDELESAVRMRAKSFIEGLEARLNKGLARLKKASDDELYPHFRDLLDRHQRLLEFEPAQK